MRAFTIPGALLLAAAFVVGCDQGTPTSQSVDLLEPQLFGAPVTLTFSPIGVFPAGYTESGMKITNAASSDPSLDSFRDVRTFRFAGQGTLLNETSAFGRRSPYKIERIDGKPFTLVSVKIQRAFSFSAVTTMTTSNGASITLAFTGFPGPTVVFPPSFECVSFVTWTNNSAFFQIDDLVVESDCAIEFAEFVIEEAELELDDEDTAEDEFEVEGFFVLGGGNDGINLPGDVVTVMFGTFSQTIPAGSFVRDDDGEGFEFDGTLPDGSRLKVDIDDDGEFEVEGKDLDLSRNDRNGSVFFSLQIGDDIGETTITLDDGEFELDDDDDEDEDE